MESEKAFNRLEWGTSSRTPIAMLPFVQHEWEATLEPAEAYFVARLAKEAAESFEPRLDDHRSPLQKRLDMYTGLSAEFALHKLTGQTWFAGLRRFTTPADVGPYQVKATRNTHYHLLVPFDALGAMPFLFAVVHGRTVRFAGWCASNEAKSRAVARGHPDVPRRLHWVPQSELRPMSSLDTVKLAARPPTNQATYTFLRDGFRRTPPNDAIRALAAVLQGAPRNEIVRFEDWNQGYRSGMRVVHRRHGAGTISRLTNRRGHATAEVAFDSNLTTTLPLESMEWGPMEPTARETPPRRVNSGPVPPTLPDGLEVGDRLHHDEFGAGEIEAVRFIKNRWRIIIEFDEIGTKTLTLELHHHQVKAASDALQAAHR